MSRPLGLPVVRSLAFVFDTAHDYAEILGGRSAGYSYSRIDNPTAVAFAAALAAHEAPGAEDVGAESFASSMAAISATLLGHLTTGQEVIGPADCYSGTWSLFTRWLPRWGIHPVLLDVTDLAVVRAALTPRTRMIYVETIANPTLSVPDLPALAEVAHRAQSRLVTMVLRVRQQSTTAFVLAGKLAGHPAVARVRYPGLPAHPHHDVATRLFRDGLFGSVLTLDVHGGREAAMDFCDGLCTVKIASSLGSVHSKASHAASTTHRQLDDAALAAAGISPGEVRLSVGVEDPEELLADLRQALEVT